MSMKFYITHGLIACLGAALLVWGSVDAFPQAAPQQPICMPLEKLRVALKKHLNEVEVGGGLINENAVVLVFASPGGETWTLVVAGSDGGACILNGGDHWFQAHIPSKGERSA